MRTRRPLATLAAFAALVVVAGCGARSEPTGELPPPYPATAEGGGDAPTVVQRRPDRVVALDRGAAELVLALGAGDRLVGAPAGTPGLAAATRTVVSTVGEIEVDQIGPLAPDLLIVTPDTDQVEVGRIAAAVDAPLYVQPSRSIDDVLRATLELGSLLGEPLAAREVAAAIRADVLRVEERLANVPTVPVFVDLGFFIRPTERSLLADLVRRSAATLVPAGDAGGSPVDLARLAASAPEVYLATSDSRQTLALLQSRPELRAVPAVANGRFAVLSADAVTTAGPEVGKALETIAAEIHPDAFR